MVCYLQVVDNLIAQNYSLFSLLGISVLLQSMAMIHPSYSPQLPLQTPVNMLWYAMQTQIIVLPLSVLCYHVFF